MFLFFLLILTVQTALRSWYRLVSETHEPFAFTNHITWKWLKCNLSPMKIQLLFIDVSHSWNPYTGAKAHDRS